ncbi:MAG: hypothetical protein ACLFMN_03180 [Desulfobacterales bacterium]
MLTKQTPNMDALFLENAFEQYRGNISPEGLQTCEHIEEVIMMCARDDPVYEQISSFSIALYILGYFDCNDLMSVPDTDTSEAGQILRQDFIPVRSENIPDDYKITEAGDKYLLVAGDPLFPEHFAVLTDRTSSRPFFPNSRFSEADLTPLMNSKMSLQALTGVKKTIFIISVKNPKAESRRIQGVKYSF